MYGFSKYFEGLIWLLIKESSVCFKIWAMKRKVFLVKLIYFGYRFTVFLTSKNKPVSTVKIPEFLLDICCFYYLSILGDVYSLVVVVFLLFWTGKLFYFYNNLCWRATQVSGGSWQVIFLLLPWFLPYLYCCFYGNLCYSLNFFGCVNLCV